MSGYHNTQITGSPKIPGSVSTVFRGLYFLGLLFILLLQGGKASAQCNAVIGSNIDPLEGCDILTIQFYDLSSGVITRSWDFGDGSQVVVAQNPVHSFTTGQNDTTFTVRLTITCASGTSTATKLVTVFAKPSVEYHVNKGSVCAITDSVCLINTSGYSALNSYLWNFGDGTISEEYEPCKTYSTPGTYDISLTIINEQGCLQSLVQEDVVTVERIPSTAFSVSANSGCSPFSVVFSNITDTVGNDYTDWTWDFGDGSPLYYGFEPTVHTFINPGEYTVNLGTVNSLGCYNYSTQVITVKPAPVARISTSSPACLNDDLVVEYTGLYHVAPTFNWVFTDALLVSGSGEGPYNVRYGSAGNKTISLTVTEDGCSSSVSEKVQITPITNVLLKISADYDTICSGQEVTFTASPIDFVNYCFYINSTVVQCSADNTYTGSSFSDGDRIYVKITDINGCTEIISDTLELHVNQTPVVVLQSSSPNDTICLNDNILFTALPAGYDEYTFFVTNTEVQKSSSNLFTTSQLQNMERVYALAQNNECVSNNSNNIYTTVKEILPAPQVYCGATSSSAIEFLWDEIPGAVGYEVSVDNGPFVVPSSGPDGLSHLLTGLASNESHSIRVRAYDATICGDGHISEEVTCMAIDCEEIGFDLHGQYTTVCENDQVSLSIDGITIPNYSVEWNELAGTNSNYYSFIARTDTVIPVKVTNLDAPLCPPVIKEFHVTVTPLREVTLQASSGSDPVCAGTGILFTALPEDFIQYMFYDNNKLIQKGPDNTYLAELPVDGHFVKVVASEGGCSVISTPVVMEVTEPLDIPQVNVSSSTINSVTFSWKPVAGASGYLISVDNGPYIVPSSGETGLTHTVSSLSPGDGVIVTVMAVGDGVCGNSESSQPAIGFAENCAAISYTLDTDYQVCSGDTVTLRIDGLNISNYMIKWGSLPPSRSRTVKVIPASDTVVAVMIRNLDRPLCPAMYSYVHIGVDQRPGSLILSSSDADNAICSGDAVSFTAEPAGYDFYEFYLGYNLVTGSSSNTYSNAALSDGQKVWALAYNNGCAGQKSNEIATAVSPPLAIPQVNCGTTTTGTISFVWDDVSDASAYLISINGAAYTDPSSGAAGLVHDITGLTNGEAVSARVMAVGPDPCGNSLPSEVKTCYAIDCDAYSFVIDPNKDACEGDEMDLYISKVNIPDYSVSWNGGTFGPDTLIHHTAVKDSTITVEIRNNSQPSCPLYSRSFEVDVVPVPTIILVSDDADNTLCNGQKVEFIVSPAAFDSYLFYQGAGLVQDSGISYYRPALIADGDEVHAEAVISGCSAVSNTVQITVLPPRTLNLSASANGDLCTDEAVSFTATSGFSHYYFRDVEGILADSDGNTTEIRVNAPGITVSALDEFSCFTQSPDTVHFNLLPLPLMIISCSDDTVCYGDFTNFFAQPPMLPEYLFYNNGSELVQGGLQNIYVTDSLEREDVISVVGVDDKGCRSHPASSAFPYILPYPDSYIMAEADGVCLYDSITLTAVTDVNYPAATYYWSTGESTGSIRVAPQYSSNYSLYYNYGLCLNKVADSKVIAVDRLPRPLAYAGEDAIICIRDSIQLEASGGMNYLWNDSLTLDEVNVYNPYAMPQLTTTYIVTVSNEYCQSVDSVTITVDRCLDDLTDPVPQIITPNGDGLNDYWVLYNIDYFENSRVEIYNRWGNIVFTASPYLNEWDGTNTAGEPLPDGTYYFILDIGNGSDPRTGFIIIHR
ncbi:MAG: PKD domain-containing protein [Bacteroidota bacterium]